ncbi:Kelch repeat protein [Caenorhabditis elegans]|uniref:Kelch repeat protein n=1 Tax=Caenorhabditis elegans TaxID=6239 RepID=O17700_CAEEL|nr:Kelch repeat protein [Caenorhabditis elegans]CAB03989.2 Kelch repeat protein [Caenorhabditis elegans]|eukprot:NP_506605.2 Uncharacterized protein CELE_C53A5.9 [Caenorhabditis elegans]
MDFLSSVILPSHTKNASQSVTALDELKTPSSEVADAWDVCDQPLEYQDAQFSESEMETQMKELEDCSIEASRVFLENLQKSFKLMKLLQLTQSLNPQESSYNRKIISTEMKKINDTVSQLKYAGKRIEMINEHLEKHRFTGKDGDAFLEPNMDPVLIADQAQSAHKPLLIGSFDPKTQKYKPIGRLPDPRANFAVASSKTNLYVIGGTHNGQFLNKFEYYNQKKNARCMGANLNHKRTKPAAGFHNGALYVVGGYDSIYLSSVELYDLEEGTWKNGPSLNNCRANAAVVACYGEIFVLGGFNGKSNEESIEKISASGNEFEIFGEMEGGRSGFGACVFQGRIYIAGGWSNTRNTLKSVRSYDPYTKTWRDEPSMKNARKAFTLHATNEAIYAIRGYDEESALLDQIERFDPKKLKWSIVPSKPHVPPTSYNYEKYYAEMSDNYSK